MTKRISLFLMAALVMLSMGFPAIQADAADEPGIKTFGSTSPDQTEPTSVTDEGYLLADRPAPEGFTVSSVEADGVAGLDMAFPPSYASPSVTSVKDQNPYGTCWAFATVGSGEAELVNNNGANKDTLDLSEIQLAYFTYHSVVDPLGGLAGDSIALPSTDNFLDAGGNRLISSFVLASWVGMTPETATAPVTYDIVNPSTTLPDSLAYGANAATLRNALWINSADINSIKQSVVSYGAVSMSYYHDDAYYNETNDAYYNGVENDTNHAVTIVGWDDTYSAANFNDTPSGDGAWLVKNSWGPSWGNSGYFWISYNDLSFSGNDYCVVYDMSQTNDYLHNYQYDGNGSLSYFYNTGEGYMANIFTAASFESIKSVMFTTLNTNSDYSIQIYRNPSPGNPTSGTACLAAPATGSLTYEGCYTVDLPQTVPLKIGDKFSVVVKLTSENPSDELCLPVDGTDDWGWVTMTGSAQPGQSFVSYSGSKWYDTDTYDCNVRVKALTVADAIIPVSMSCTKTDASLYGAANGNITISASGGNSGTYLYSIDGGATWSSTNSFSVPEGTYTAAACDALNNGNAQTQTVMIGQPPSRGTVSAAKVPSKVNAGTAVTMIPPVAPRGYTVQSITYSSSNPAIASVDSNGNVTFLAGGKVTIITKVISQTVDKKGKVKSKTTTVKKTVSVQQPISSISLNLTDTTIARTQKVKLTASIAPGTASNKKLTWKSSNPKVAAVSSAGVVTGKAGGTAVISCTAKDGSGVSASCTVSVTPIYPTGLKMSKAALTLKMGKTAALKATIAPKNTDYKTVSWASNNPAVATVDAKGRVKAIAPGTATITATTNNGIVTSSTVTVQ